MYLNSYLNLFKDTWIDNIYLIEKNYIDFATKFRDDIYNKINLKCLEEKIYWYTVLGNNNYEIKTIVGNYRIFIEYSENNQEKIRFIENVEFYKK